MRNKVGCPCGVIDSGIVVGSITFIFDQMPLGKV